MSFEIENIDKSNFQCFQLSDQSVYFGEIKSKEGCANGVRDGFGIQVFSVNGKDQLCKYEGFWKDDAQEGQCHIYYPDKSEYIGNVVKGVKEGYGKFIWQNGDVYEGFWKNGRMEGGGNFTNHDGSQYKGIFKNNYFLAGNGSILNPFLSREEVQEFLKRRNEINLLKEKNQKQKLFYFTFVNDYSKLVEQILKSNKNNRIPLVISSKQKNADILEVFNFIKENQKTEWFNMDVRAVKQSKSDPNAYAIQMKNIKQNLSNTLVKGDLFVINLDDSKNTVYNEIYYPDFNEFYHYESFPRQIWQLDELKKFQVYEKIISNTKNQLKLDLSEEIKICLWSKLKIDQTREQKQIIEFIERRFGPMIPMIKIDFIVLSE